MRHAKPVRGWQLLVPSFLGRVSMCDFKMCTATQQQHFQCELWRTSGMPHRCGEHGLVIVVWRSAHAHQLVQPGHNFQLPSLQRQGLDLGGDCQQPFWSKRADGWATCRTLAVMRMFLPKVSMRDIPFSASRQKTTG